MDFREKNPTVIATHYTVAGDGGCRQRICQLISYTRAWLSRICLLCARVCSVENPKLTACVARQHTRTLVIMVCVCGIIVYGMLPGAVGWLSGFAQHKTCVNFIILQLHYLFWLTVVIAFAFSISPVGLIDEWGQPVSGCKIRDYLCDRSIIMIELYRYVAHTTATLMMWCDRYATEEQLESIQWCMLI